VLLDIEVSPHPPPPLHLHLVAQTHIPIFSLPQEWLWCESWCSDASKAAAKTIDLCNNPKVRDLLA
jgi:hypothetical protein